jgi:RecJ-like exonuclease
MKRRNFLAGITALFAASCARNEQRQARYDEKECPFCKDKKGTCSYCGGDTKCSFCGGSGKRVTVIPRLSEGNFNRTSYEEECPYCKGSGKCHYCEGTGTCWACDGNGHVESWNFLKEKKPEKKG